MALTEVRTEFTLLEEELVINWRKLSEKDKMRHFRSIQSDSLQSRDPVQDARVGAALGKVPVTK